MKGTRRSFKKTGALQGDACRAGRRTWLSDHAAGLAVCVAGEIPGILDAKGPFRCSETASTLHSTWQSFTCARIRDQTLIFDCEMKEISCTTTQGHIRLFRQSRPGMQPETKALIFADDRNGLHLRLYFLLRKQRNSRQEISLICTGMSEYQKLILTNLFLNRD